MGALDWAKEQQQAYQENAEQRARAQGRDEKDVLDVNELGKLIATLRHRGQFELKQVASDLATTDRNGRAGNPFARRSGKYAQAFADLHQHVVDRLPLNHQESFRSMRWLKRLLDIQKENPALLNWLLQDEQHGAAAPPTSPPEPRIQISLSSHHAQDRQGNEGKKREKKKDRR